MVKFETDFMEILNRTIDETIRGIMGEGTSEIFNYLQHNGINTHRLGDDPEALERVMTEIFKAGWRVFKRAILGSFCEQLSISMDKFANHSFVQCITIAEMEFFAKSMISRRNQVTKAKQNNELKTDHVSILKLSLPNIEPGSMNKSCKICGNNIDIDNNDSERLLAELCPQCWKMQYEIWESPMVESFIPHERKHIDDGDD